MTAHHCTSAWLSQFAAAGGHIFPHDTGFRVVIRYDTTTQAQRERAVIMVNDLSASGLAGRIAADLLHMTPAEVVEAQQVIA